MVSVGALALAIFFIAIAVVYALTLVSPGSSGAGGVGGRIESISSAGVRRALMLWLSLGSVLLYCYICDRTEIFTPHGLREYSSSGYWGMVAIFFLLSVATIRMNHKGNSKICNREQTEEWKGWMQIGFVMYHYFKASHTYNMIRVFIACYVWMTGFGNFSFFYIKRDYSLTRFAKMIWRLNFFVAFLCLTMNTPYMLYYICALHTFNFLLVYVTMYIMAEYNTHKWFMTFKLCVLFGLLYLIYDVEGVSSNVWGLVGSAYPLSSLLVYKGSMYEWQFRSGLDRYDVVFGMAFALNFPMLEANMLAVEQFEPWRRYKIAAYMALFMGFMVWVWSSSIYINDKYAYNKLHPYTFFMPMYAFIWLRNSCELLRKHSSWFLGECGKITLETYLLQLHILMTSDARTLLVIIADWPILNGILVMLIYLACAKCVFEVTTQLRDLCINGDERDLLWRTGFAVVSAFVLWCMGWVASLCSSVSSEVVVLTFFAALYSVAIVMFLSTPTFHRGSRST